MKIELKLVENENELTHGHTTGATCEKKFQFRSSIKMP